MFRSHGEAHFETGQIEGDEIDERFPLDFVQTRDHVIVVGKNVGREKIGTDDAHVDAPLVPHRMPLSSP